MLAVLLAFFPLASAVSYTVQVVAVSSENSAADFQAYLQDEGFPAYLVTVPSGQNYIFRLRVGAFANREAAQVFSEALAVSLENSPLSSSPSPALAEGIPSELIPLEPALLGRYDLETYGVEVRPWGNGSAVRAQPRDLSEPATYVLGDGSSFRAWRAEPQTGRGIVQVYSEYLWPEAWQIESEADLAQYRQERLDVLATELNLSSSALMSFEYQDAEGAPYLVLARRVDAGTGEAELLPAVGQQTAPAAEGPPLAWLASTPELELPRWLPDFEVGLSEPPDSVALGEWQAVADGAYSFLQQDDGRGWRAAVGSPLWAGENLLLTRFGDEALLYSFEER